MKSEERQLYYLVAYYFAITSILTKTRPALSCNQALIYFPWYRFLASKMNREVLHLVHNGYT